MVLRRPVELAPFLGTWPSAELGRFPLSEESVSRDLVFSGGFNGTSYSGKFIVSKADEEYDARDTGPKRGFRFGPVCS